MIGMSLRVAALSLCLSAAFAWADEPAPLRELPYSPSLNVDALDRAIDPCDNFYQFSCGGWLQRNPIPSDHATWSVYAKLEHDNQQYLWGLLQEVATPRADRSSAEQKTGDYFAACLREDDIDAAGLQPLEPLLKRIGALHSRQELAPLIAHLHANGVDALFHLSAAQDYANSSRVIAHLDAGGLGLPDRDYYLKADERSQGLRAAYLAHVQRMFKLLGEGDDTARAHAQVVMRMETALARASYTRVQRRNPQSLHHPSKWGDASRWASTFDWNAYINARQLRHKASINIVEPEFLQRMGTLVGTRPMDEWRAYLRWHTVRTWAPYLSKPFVQASFDFYSTTLAGVKVMQPRWLRCVQWVDRDLGEALGQVFVAKTFSASTRDRAADMTRRIEAAMAARIHQLEWMSAPSKQAALEKLHALVNNIGYPDRWRDYSALHIDAQRFFANVQASAVFEERRQLAKIGKPVDRSEWQMTPPTVNAYYEPQLNTINFPAGILQPPLFDPRTDDAPNYGNTGSTIGHELTHAFDDEGRQFDAKGNLRDWWAPKDAQAFAQRAACVSDQYSAYTVVDDLHVNGKLTLGEDIADLGGTVLGYIAWKQATADQKLEPIEGFTPDQRFFIGMAQWACTNQTPEMQRLRVQIDPHSPPQYRINGVVSNMPEFARAFNCKPGQAMAKEPSKICRVW